MATLRTTFVQHPSAASPNIVLAADGSFAGVNTNGFAYAGTRYYTSNGTFDKTDAFGDGSNVAPRAIRVRVWGGGGGGRAPSANNQPAAGGGGGAYAESFITNIAGLSTSETVTRGAGGAGGASGGGGGTNGATSSFGTLVVAGGGGGGSEFDAGFGGTATAGDLQMTGGAGQPGNGTEGIGCAGGNAPQGGGGGRGFGRGTFNTAGEQGGFPGGGGGGGRRASAAVGGGAGANGIVIIDVFV